jgi:3D (Asp-Asp-Asp) domain-containing protein
MSRQLVSAILLLAIGTLSSAVVSDASPAPETGDIALAHEGDALINQSPVATPDDVSPDAKRVVTATITAYSSETAQTDSTPYLTAAGTSVRHGIVAANWLPIGTQVRIPSIFGDRIFVVEDRMNKRHTNRLDVWFPTKWEAVSFGVHEAEVEIL